MSTLFAEGAFRFSAIGCPTRARHYFVILSHGGDDSLARLLNV